MKTSFAVLVAAGLAAAASGCSKPDEPVKPVTPPVTAPPTTPAPTDTPAAPAADAAKPPA